MSVLTVRITEKEKARLARRAKSEGTTTDGLVRRMIREQPFLTAADLVEEMDALLGDKRLAIKPRR
jgi:hypothetical protein